MSKPVKQMIMADYRRRFESLEGALVIDIRGIDANENNALRLGLAERDIRITVVKNALARKAIAGTDLEPLAPALAGPAALVYGADSVVSVARALVEWARKVDQLDLKGAVLDGEFFEGAEGVRKLSAFPTREEAQARVVQLFLAPAGNVVGALTNPGATILGVVKEIQERLEQGETIEKS